MNLQQNEKEAGHNVLFINPVCTGFFYARSELHSAITVHLAIRLGKNLLIVCCVYYQAALKT